MICKKCSFENAEGAAVCAKCGAKLAKKINWLKVLIPVAAVLVVLAVASVLLLPKLLNKDAGIEGSEQGALNPNGGADGAVESGTGSLQHIEEVAAALQNTLAAGTFKAELSYKVVGADSAVMGLVFQGYASFDPSNDTYKACVVYDNQKYAAYMSRNGGYVVMGENSQEYELLYEKSAYTDIIFDLLAGKNAGLGWDSADDFVSLLEQLSGVSGEEIRASVDVDALEAVAISVGEALKSQEGMDALGLVYSKDGDMTMCSVAPDYIKLFDLVLSKLQPLFTDPNMYTEMMNAYKNLKTQQIDLPSFTLSVSLQRDKLVNLSFVMENKDPQYGGKYEITATLSEFGAARPELDMFTDDGIAQAKINYDHHAALSDAKNAMTTYFSASEGTIGEGSKIVVKSGEQWYVFTYLNSNIESGDVIAPFATEPTFTEGGYVRVSQAEVPALAANVVMYLIPIG